MDKKEDVKIGKRHSEPVSKTSKNRTNTLAVILSAVFLINGVNSAIKASKKGYVSEDMSSFSTKELYTAINTNPNLTEDEKEVLDNISDFLDDYYYYIDYNTACPQLNNFDINYEEIDCDNSIYTAGDWSSFTHDMNIYTCDGEPCCLEDNPVAGHELIHLISVDGSYYPDALEEGIDSLILAEYSNYYDAYYKQRLITMMLCEIVNPDSIIKSFLRKDFSIIEDELLTIDEDKSNLKALKTLLDKYHDNYIECCDYYDKKLSSNILLKNKAHTCFKREQEYLCKINDILCDYYTKKTGKSVGDPVSLHMFYPDEYLPLFENGDVIENIKENYSTLFSIYSSHLISKSYFYDACTYYSTNEPSISTGYFNKKYKDNIVTVDDYLTIDSDSNKVIKLKR